MIHKVTSLVNRSSDNTCSVVFGKLYIYKAMDGHSGFSYK